MSPLASANADAEPKPSGPLTEIETLISRVRAGEVGEDDALSRIAGLVRGLDRFQTYQKPLG